MNFEQKVRSLKNYEIVELMVESLKNPVCEVDMGSFGRYENGICFGCAATQLVQHLSGVKFTSNSILSPRNRSQFMKCDYFFLLTFEKAIDALRVGDTSFYNLCAREINIERIPSDYPYELPPLFTDNYLSNPHHYTHFAEWLKKQK